VPDTPAQRQACDAGVAERPARRRQPVPLTGCVEVLPERSSTASCGLRLRIDYDLAHQAQVDDEASVAYAMARDTVASSAHGYRQIRFARETQSRQDVLDIEGPRDQLRAPLDHPVERRTRDVEAAVGRVDDRPAMTLSQFAQRRHRASLREVMPGR
jgi:hypothetical protein